jgi:hypothetical protein
MTRGGASPKTRSAAPAASARRATATSSVPESPSGDGLIDELDVLAGLRREIARLLADNQGLVERVAVLSAPRRSPDDFAVALQRMVDDVQSRLAMLANPVSNFAVKELHLDAPVAISVTRLGAVEYRFLRPGDPADPNTTTRLSLTLVPIEKQSTAGTLPGDLFKADLGLERIGRLDQKTLDLLHGNQIFTLGELVRVGTRAQGRVELGNLLKAGSEKIAEWLSLAELLLVREIDEARAYQLFALGIRSLADLAKQEPRRLSERVGAKAEEAKRWVDVARYFEGLAPLPAATTEDSASR